MRPVNLLAAVVLVAGFGACGPDPEPGAAGGAGGAVDEDAGPATDADRVTLIQRLYDYGLDFGETRAEIEESLGTPVRADTALAENRHVPSATDTLFTLVYDGLTFELNRPGPVDRDLLTSVTLPDGGRELPGGLGIGTGRSRLTGSLGTPAYTRAAESGTLLAYRAPGSEVEQFVEFVVRNDTVRGIRWVPYVD